MRRCLLLMAIAAGLPGAHPERVLQVQLKNAGTQPRDITIGMEGSAGPFYDIELTAYGPRGEKLAVFDRVALKALPNSMPSPILLHLAPGEVHEFTYPVSRLLCVVDRQDVALEKLLRQGYVVGASLLGGSGGGAVWSLKVRIRT